MSYQFLAVVGSESHSTSSGSASVLRNGVQTKWKSCTPCAGNDKHCRYFEGLFAVNDGDIITYKARANRGNKGAEKHEFHRSYRFDHTLEVIEIKPDVGYPCEPALLTGRFVEVEDLIVSEKTKKVAL